MSKLITRRKLILGAASAGGLIIAGTSLSKEHAIAAYFGMNRVGETLSRLSHRALLSGNPLAREFSVSDISAPFPTIGTVMPEGELYQRQLANRFVDWKLPIDGLVSRPLTLSLADLKQFPARTQITAHSCERGWTAIAQWTGVQLSRVLELVTPLAKARYVVVHCADGWYDTFTLDHFEALHPQTILAYGMNDADLPTAHGAPVRLRVERQLGYKSLKFITRIQLAERFDDIGRGYGSFAADLGYQWYAGI